MLQAKVKLVRGGVKVPPPPLGKGLASLSAPKSRGGLADQQVKDLLLVFRRWQWDPLTWEQRRELPRPCETPSWAR